MPDLDALRLRKQLQTERSFYWLVIVALLISLGTIIFADSQCAIDVGGKTVAYVRGTKVARRILGRLNHEYESRATREFGKAIGGSLRFRPALRYYRRQADGPRVLSEKATLRALHEEISHHDLTPEVKATVILVKNTPVVAVPTNAMARSVLHGVKLKLVELRGGDTSKADKQSLVGGEKVVEQYVDLALMQSSADDAVAFLLRGQKSEPSSQPHRDRSSYTVEPGDTGSSIARFANTTVEELERLNPGINWMTLKPGDKVKVPAGTVTSSVAPPGAKIPASASTANLSVQTTRETTVEEVIPYKTKRLRSLRLASGAEQVRRKGEKGLLRVRYRIHLQNGKEVKREEIDRRVIKQPVDEDILYGASSSPGP